MIKVGILGATAYTSLELIKILLKHSQVEITYLGVRRKEKLKISDIFPTLESRLDIECTDLEPENIPDNVELIFVTLPPVIAMDYVPGILKKGIKVIDFSADYRFKDKNIYETCYKSEHKDAVGITKAVYGLPELFKEDIRNCTLVGNPGCYPTGTIIGLAPLIKSGIIELDDIIVDSKSGVSGAGREPTELTHYCERNENFEAYKIGNHRHTPEIDHILSRISKTDISIFFTPHLTPMNRGILNTIYAKVKNGITIRDIQTSFTNLYNSEPFVRIKKGETLPCVKDVTFSNFCDVAFRLVKDRVIVISCIDNLIKGAAGQAVQNMNLMLGFEETCSLL